MKTLYLLFLLSLIPQCVFASNSNYHTLITRQAKQIKSLQVRLEKMENTIIKMQEQIDSYDKVIKQLSRTVEKSNVPTLESANLFAIIKSQDINNYPKDTAQLPIKIKSSDGQHDYDLALSTLKDGDFDKSEELFAKFINNYPNSVLQSKALFWYGESFYHRSLYNKAAINYLKCYKSSSRGPKAKDALFKLSLSLAKLQRNSEACSILDKLESEFTNQPQYFKEKLYRLRAQLACDNAQSNDSK